jgi:hypothetical protein
MLPLAEKILRLQQQIGKEYITDAQIETAVGALNQSVKDRTITTWAAFTPEKEMVAYLVQSFSLRFPRTWMMPFLIRNPNYAAPWNYAKNGMDELWQAAFRHAASQHRNIVTWSLPIEWAQTAQRTKLTSSVWKNLHIHTFSVVKAGEMPTNKFDLYTFGTRAKPYDVVLRAAWQNDVNGMDALNRYREYGNVLLSQSPQGTLS